MPRKLLKPYSMHWIDHEPEAGAARCGWNAFSLAGTEGFCSPALDLATWAAWATQVPELLRTESAQPLRQEFIPTRGRQTFLTTGPFEQELVVKQYSADAGMECPAAGLIGGDLAWRAFRRQLALHRLGQPVPEPLLFFASRPACSAPRWCAVSRLLKDCVTVLEFAFEHLRRRARKLPALRSWTRDVVRAVALLHQAGFAHGDLHQQNILIRQRPGAAHLEVFWTDFDACERSAGPWPSPAQMVDLAMLAASLDGLVPPALLRRGLAHYVALGNLEAAHRRQGSLQALTEAYDRFLVEFRHDSARLEQCCLAGAEHCLASAT